MKTKEKKSIYKALGKEIQEKVAITHAEEKIDLGQSIRKLRMEKKLKGIELCREAGLDPRTLTAIEKGRIKNPSIKVLQSVARGLGVSVSEIFRQSEIDLNRYFYVGSQKGAYQVDFPAQGIKAVSFTPFMHDFFCGKFIFGAKRKLEENMLDHPWPIFVSTLVGRFDLNIEGKSMSLKEGENVFLNGMLKHSFYNPLQRDSVLMVTTAPSFFK